MVEIELKSKDLTEYVYLALNKNRNTPLYDEDIEEIEDITLDALDFLDEPTDTTIYDLIFFTNLKTCMIVNMKITENEIDLLNKLESIESIQFTNCNLPRGKKLKLNASYVIIDNCNNFALDSINEMCNVKKLRIVNCENLNVAGIEKMESIAVLYLQNINIEDVSFVTNLHSLEYLNLNGTKIKKSTNVLDGLKIKIDHEDKNYIYDVEN